MKKNKTVAFMLAASLLVGGTFLGTKAIFEDKGNAYNDLVITMGNLNVDVDEGEWKLDPQRMEPGHESEATNTGSKDVFANVKPGDAFVKTVKITNNGSLTQKVTVTGGNLLKPLDETIVKTGSDLYGLNIELKAGESVEKVIKVEIPTKAPGAFGESGSYNKPGKYAINFNDIIAPFEIHAEQK